MRFLALGTGIFSLLSFATAIGLMAFGLWSGMDGRSSLPPALVVAWDLLLILQFPLLHSTVLNKGQRWLDLVMPKAIARTMRPTIYSTLASWQLILVFSTWQSTGVTLARPSALLTNVLTVGFAASWLLLIKSINEAGVHVQTGIIGWWSVWRGRKPVFPSFPTRGLHKTCRHPIYLSFALIMLTSPAFTLDRLVLAGLWTVYCVAGPLLKERRMRRFHGPRYEEYARRTPYLIPGLQPARGPRP